MKPSPPISESDLQRFRGVATISDTEGFLTVLRDLVAERAANGPVGDVPADVAARARAFEAPVPHLPSVKELQRGRMLQLSVFEHKSNVPIARYASLAKKSRQGLYEAVAARKLLGLSLLGRRGIRVPDWQLQPAPLALTRAVLRKAADVDPWTIYQVLSTPDDGDGGQAPVAAVTPATVDAFADRLCARLGVTG